MLVGGSVVLKNLGMEFLTFWPVRDVWNFRKLRKTVPSPFFFFDKIPWRRQLREGMRGVFGASSSRTLTTMARSMVGWRQAGRHDCKSVEESAHPDSQIWSKNKLVMTEVTRKSKSYSSNKPTMNPTSLSFQNSSFDWE